MKATELVDKGNISVPTKETPQAAATLNSDIKVLLFKRLG